MGKSARRTISTIITMLVIAAIIVVFYFYLTSKGKGEDNSLKDLSDAEVLLQKDIELYYPETPKEVVKLYWQITKCIYSGIKDKEVDELAKKMYQLFDPEFQKETQEEQYLKDLKSEIASYMKKDKTITSFIVDYNKKMVEKTVDKVDYAYLDVSYWIRSKKGKDQFFERFILRKNESEQWKILGWKTISDPAEND